MQEEDEQEGPAFVELFLDHSVEGHCQARVGLVGDGHVAAAVEDHVAADEEHLHRRLVRASRASSSVCRVGKVVIVSCAQEKLDMMVAFWAVSRSIGPAQALERGKTDVPSWGAARGFDSCFRREKRPTYVGKR